VNATEPRKLKACKLTGVGYRHISVTKGAFVAIIDSRFSHVFLEIAFIPGSNSHPPVTFATPAALEKSSSVNQQVTLLGNARRVAKPRANHMQWELTLQFGLPAGPPLLKLYGVEQSWPTRDAREAQESRHFGA
jgi:hypothetical protein